MTPLNPDHINQSDKVLHSFQASLDYEKLHESSPEAGKSFETAEDCINIAASLTAKSGLPGLDRMIATGHDSRFMLFSMHSANEESPGPRLFGITTKADAKVGDISELTRAVL